MKRKHLILLTLIFLVILTGCSKSNSPSAASTHSFSDETPQNNDKSHPTIEPVNENSWDYIVSNYPYVSYDEVKNGNYNNQYVILPVIIDNVEYFDTSDWVTCNAWFFHDQTYIPDNITFQCDELLDYSPKSLVSGDNLDICFYINKDSSFGFDIKGFSKSEETITLNSIYDSFKENCSPLDYKSILRSPENFSGCTFTFSGTVFQIIEQDNDSLEFLLFTGSDDEYIHIRYCYKDNDFRILENDEMTLYGTFYKLYDYVSMLSANYSIPDIVVEFINNTTASSDLERELFIDSETIVSTDSDSVSSLNDLSLGGPDELELMSYAQTVLDNHLPDCKYSRNKTEYTFVKTNLRYKIEGEVSRTKDSPSEKFYMIIKFTNEKYDTYDLISLQIGNDIIYETSTNDELTLPANPSDSEILTEKNAKMYNDVMNALYADPERPENEILEELAPEYNMTATELKDFLYNYMEAYYQ